MKVDVLAYVEDNELVVGLRSNIPHSQCGLFDGNCYFNYYTINKEEKEIMTMNIIPTNNGWDILVEDELWDEVPLDGSYTSSFSINI
jgi:hypothetical protein